MPARPAADAGDHWRKWAVGLALWVPVVVLMIQAVTDRLGANPAEALIRGTGDWALRMICLALAVTPARVILGQPALARYRRLLGLTAFGYVCLHFASYLWLDMAFDWDDTLRDIAKRPFIAVGFTAWLLLTPLAATSTDGAVRRLGGKAWRAVHRLVFPAALLALLHFFWMRAAKRNFGEVALYAAVIGFLLVWRLWQWRRRRRPAPGASRPGVQARI